MHCFFVVVVVFVGMRCFINYTIYHAVHIFTSRMLARARLYLRACVCSMCAGGGCRRPQRTAREYQHKNSASKWENLQHTITLDFMPYSYDSVLYVCVCLHVCTIISAPLPARARFCAYTNTHTHHPGVWWHVLYNSPYMCVCFWAHMCYTKEKRNKKTKTREYTP